MTESGTISKQKFLLGAVILVALSAFYLKTVCFVLDANVDEGLMSMGADLLVRGGLIYRDFFSVVWPGSYFILAAYFKGFGATWEVARGGLLFELLLMLTLVLTLSRQLIRSTLVFLPACYFVILGPAPWNFNYYHWNGLLFFLGTTTVLAFLIKEENYKPARQKRFLQLSYSAGITGALAVICFQAIGPAILLGFATSTILILTIGGDRKTALIALALMLGGFASVMLIFLIYLIASNDLMPMIDMTVRFVVGSYGHVNAVPYGFSKFFNQVVMVTSFSPGKELESFLKILIGSLCWAPYETVKMAPGLVVVGATIYLLRRGSLRQSAINYAPVWLFAALGFGFWLAELHRPDIVRLFWGSQLLIIINVFFLERCLAVIPASRLAARLTIAIILTGLVIDALCYVSRTTNNIFHLTTRRGPVTAFEDWRIINAIEEVTEPDEKILVYPYNTSVYFLSRTQCPAHYPWLQYNYHSHADFQTAIDDMERSKVRCVVWDSSLSNDSFAENGFPSYASIEPEKMIMEKYLTEKYKFVKAYGRFRLMVRKD